MAIPTAVTPKIGNVRLTGGLLGHIYENTRDKVIPYMWDILNDAPGIEASPAAPGSAEAYPSHCIANFKIAAGLETGSFYGMPFQDTDLAKWLEAVAYFLESNPNPGLEARADEVIDIIEKAQETDGYLDTFFTLTAPGKKFTNLTECHELYTTGHMMEAAVAYYRATGKRKLLDVMLRMAKLIDSKLGPESEGKLPGYPGHEEIELALVKLYEVTGEAFLLKLAKFFIDARGTEPNYFRQELKRNGITRCFDMVYYQADKPIRQQREFLGHAVRAMYMACGIVDVAVKTEDTELIETAKTLFENLRSSKLYITGGIGSAESGERFTGSYDLPNDTVYAETCASIGLIFFMRRMLQLEQDSKYADILERALYNTCLASTSLDGKRYFYVNPLEVTPEIIHRNPGLSHVLPVRPQWFGCACCPPNLARMVAALGEDLYCTAGDTVYVHLYAPNEATLQAAGQEIHLRTETNYPRKLSIGITLSGGSYRLALRIPDWCRGRYQLRVNGEAVPHELVKGYAVIARAWAEGDKVTLAFPEEVQRVYASPNVKADVGKVAVQYGPIVYCLEEADNGKGLHRLYLNRDSVFQKVWRPEKLGGIVEITAQGRRQSSDAPLYRYDAPAYEDMVLTFIPYYTWANRGENEMAVWVHET